jgi:hypothetical protein
LGLGERGGEQREDGRREQRGEHALHGARGDQHADVDRGTADGGGQREAEQADEQHPLPADDVGNPAADEQQ